MYIYIYIYIYIYVYIYIPTFYAFIQQCRITIFLKRHLLKKKYVYIFSFIQDSQAVMFFIFISSSNQEK